MNDFVCFVYDYNNHFVQPMLVKVASIFLPISRRVNRRIGTKVRPCFILFKVEKNEFFSVSGNQS